MKLVKARFERTEFGGQMVETVKALDFYLEEKSHTSQWQEPEKYKRLRKNIDRSFAQFEIFKLAVKQFYGVEYHFTRTDDYFGCCTEDGEDFLFRIDRKIDLIKRMQTEMDHRAEVEEKAVQLITEGRHGEAVALLNSLDDSVIAGMQEEFEAIEAAGGKEIE